MGSVHTISFLAMKFHADWEDIVKWQFQHTNQIAPGKKIWKYKSVDGNDLHRAVCVCVCVHVCVCLEQCTRKPISIVSNEDLKDYWTLMS